MTAPDRDRLEALAATAIRGLTIDAVESANSGHPGLPMGMADAAVALWSRQLAFDPDAPDWPDRDRFVLSAGHGSILLYSLLHLAGYDLSLDDLRAFRQLGSRTPGHPERGHTPGVETTTGPLGQGLATAVGMAIAEAHLAATFNTADHTVVDHRTYVVASDGDLMEGVTNEASSLAAHLGLGKLVVLYDDNSVTIDGVTGLAWSESRADRYRALGWHVIDAVDGHDRDAVDAALAEARAETTRPSLLCVQTVIGFGSPALAGKPDIHSDALGRDELEATKRALGIELDPLYHLPEGSADALRAAADRGRQAYVDWQRRLDAYAEAHPERAAELRRRLEGRLPDGWTGALPTFAPDAKGLATRAASGKVLDALAPVLPELVGGSADLTPSNKTQAAGMTPLTADDPAGRYVHFGIREHAMGAALNGMALHGGVRPYGGTFLVFSDYMKPAVRLAALMRVPSVFVFTHDSVGLGEDGPTHQPVEHLAALRAVPGLDVVRPADANETAAAWRLALSHTDRPTALALTRQNVPTLDGTRERAADGVARGGYTLVDTDGTPDVILVGTGSEVALCVEAAEALAADGVAARVVSMPCVERFLAQDAGYRDAVLPPAVRARVAVEAGATLGWGRIVGLDGAVIGVDRFGESAPYEEVYRALGITAEAVADAARRVTAALAAR